MGKKRIIVVGGGAGGLELARKLGTYFSAKDVFSAFVLALNNSLNCSGAKQCFSAKQCFGAIFKR